MGDNTMGDPATRNGQAGARPQAVAWGAADNAIHQTAEHGWADAAGVSNNAGEFLPVDAKPVVDPLPLTTRLTYALPAFSTTSLTILISLYINDFYGVNLLAVASVRSAPDSSWQVAAQHCVASNRITPCSEPGDEPCVSVLLYSARQVL